MIPEATLYIKTTSADIERLTPLFGSGVGIVTYDGIGLMSLLCDQLGMDRDYVDQRVQTVFVNSRAVDQLEQVILSADAVVALSAAMPGLVGATFRKQGLLAGFRKDISHVSDTSIHHDRHETVVTLKLFNLVAKELGPELLQRKVWLRGRQVPDLLKLLCTAEGMKNGTIVWDNELLSDEAMETFDWPDGWVALDVEILEER